MDENELGIETMLAHFGEDPENQLGAVAPPIYQSSLFTFPDAKSFSDWMTSDRYFYTRMDNPTTVLLEKKLAALEKAEKSVFTSSGMSAISSAIVACIKSGDHVICIDAVYGPTRMLLDSLKKKFGITVDYVDGCKIEDFTNAITKQTKLIYLESPSSMLFQLQDLSAISAVAREKNIYTICDNSWASPLYQQPVSLGIDLVVHSATKYINGHSDTLGGAIMGNGRLINHIHDWERPLYGGSADPMASWLMLRGLRTIPIRLERHAKTALACAKLIESFSSVRTVNYPGLESHPQYQLAKKQMSGFSGLFSFELNDCSKENVFKFVDSLKLFKIGCSWGGYESLVVPHKLSDDKWLIRLSIGLESEQDLMEDLSKAFN